MIYKVTRYSFHSTSGLFEGVRLHSIVVTLRNSAFTSSPGKSKINHNGKAGKIQRCADLPSIEYGVWPLTYPAILFKAIQINGNTFPKGLTWHTIINDAFPQHCIAR